MRTRVALVLLASVLAGATSAAAQTRLAWSHPKVADVLSDAVVTFAVVQPCAYSDAPTHRSLKSFFTAGWHWDGSCLGVEAGRILLAVASAEVTKRAVSKRRPDGSDNKSFFSEHTTITVAAGHWIEPKKLLLGATVAYLRIAAAKHDGIDVGTGFSVGYAIRWGAQQR